MPGERVVLFLETLEVDPKHPERMRAFSALPERDGRVLRVAYVPLADGYRILTLFLDRGRRKRQR